jgi:uncharacterized damage-inducible protein DinB
MERAELVELLDHMEWADVQTWRAVRALPAAASDERLKWLLHHLQLVRSIYLQAWRGEAFQLTELDSYPDLAAIDAWTRPYFAQVHEFAKGVDNAGFGEPVDFPWSAMIAEKFGQVLPATLGQSVWQVLTHTAYHRGQIAVRIRELGGEPPLVDFLYWVWAGKPAAGAD